MSSSEQTINSGEQIRNDKIIVLIFIGKETMENNKTIKINVEFGYFVLSEISALIDTAINY